MLTWLWFTTCIVPIYSSSTVQLYYVRKIERSDFHLIVENYFICKATGNIIQWGLANTSLGGFNRNSLAGNSIVSGDNGIHYTISLLAKNVENNSSFVFTSALVLFMEGDVGVIASCSNNFQRSFKSTNDNPMYDEYPNKKVTTNTVAIDYILSAPIFRNSELLLHIFFCVSQNQIQTIGIEGQSAVGFTKDDHVGASNFILSQDNSITNLLTVLITRQYNRTASIIFALLDFKFILKCGFKSEVVQIQSNKEFDLYILAMNTITTVEMNTSSGNKKYF